MPREEFLARMDAQIEQVRSGERLEGVEGSLLVPGERGQRRRDALQAEGVAPLSAAAWDDLARTCARADVPVPDIVGV